jgi:hypothetical protein
MKEIEEHLPRWVIQIEALKKEAEQRLRKENKNSPKKEERRIR